MGWRFAEQVIRRQRRRRQRKKVSQITIDMDLTHDETHGQQPLAFFNGFHGVWCYLPMLGFISFDDEPEQYLVAALLRPGNAPATTGLLPLLRRLVKLLRQAFPKAHLRLRLDAGFPSPEVLDYLESEGLEYDACGSRRWAGSPLRHYPHHPGKPLRAPQPYSPDDLDGSSTTSGLQADIGPLPAAEPSTNLTRGAPRCLGEEH